MKQKSWATFFQKVLLATAVAFVIAVAPLPGWTPAVFLYWQVPATVAVLIIYVGKLLIDMLLFRKK